MLNVDTIKNGLVIDHIQAGLGWRVFSTGLVWTRQVLQQPSS